MDAESFFLGYCRTLGRPMSAKATKDLRDSVEFLKWKIKPDYIVGAGRLSMFISFILIASLIIAGFLIGLDVLMFIIALPVSILIFFLITEWPKILARNRAIKSLGYAPQLIAQIAIPLKQNPNLEEALSFASENSDDEMTSDIKRMLWDVWSGKIRTMTDGLVSISKKWGKFSPGFQRSIFLIVSSFHERGERKKEMLDKSMSVILDDVMSKMKEYTNSLHIPTLLLFSLGIIVPLMIVSLFPVVSFFGVSISPYTIALFLAVSLIATFLYSNIVLEKRPPSFSRYDIRTDIPEGYMKVGINVPAAQFSAILAILIAVPGMFIYMFSRSMVLPQILDFLPSLGTLIAVWGMGIGISVYAWGTSADKVALSKRIRKEEEEFLDGLYHTKNRLLDGKPIEDALGFTADALTGMEIANTFRSLSNKMKRRSMTFEKALKDEKMRSRTIESTFLLLNSSLKKGVKFAAQTAEVIVEYLTRIRETEKTLVDMLQKHLSMMKATAIFFAPMVCSIIVVLFEMITRTISKAGDRFNVFGYSGIGEGILATPLVTTEMLQLIVGIYMIVLNFVLIRYVNRIQWGFDEVKFKVDIARSIPLTLLIFSVTLIMVRSLLLTEGLLF